MTYEEYRAIRETEEAEQEAKRKAERQARLAAECGKTPEQRRAELEAMPYDVRYAYEKCMEARQKAAEQLACSIANLSAAVRRAGGTIAAIDHA